MRICVYAGVNRHHYITRWMLRGCGGYRGRRLSSARALKRKSPLLNKTICAAAAPTAIAMMNETHGGDNILKVSVDIVSPSLIPVWLTHGYRAARATTHLYPGELTTFLYLKF